MVTTARPSTCVAIGGRGVMIDGPPGSGKSGVALELIDRGAELVGDDSLLIEARTGSLFAMPHPNTRGLIEVRNLGLISFPVKEEVSVALVLQLDPSAPRFIENAETTNILGVQIPLIRLRPESGPMAIKAELALQRYGITKSPG